MPAAEYAVGADISGGVGSSPSCLSIIRILTGEKVGEYLNPHIKPGEFAVLAVAICRLFADERGDGAYFVWEQQGPGVPFGQTVIDLRYQRLYYKTDGLGKRTS